MLGLGVFAGIAGGGQAGAEEDPGMRCQGGAWPAGVSAEVAGPGVGQAGAEAQWLGGEDPGGGDQAGAGPVEVSAGLTGPGGSPGGGPGGGQTGAGEDPGGRDQVGARPAGAHAGVQGPSAGLVGTGTGAWGLLWAPGMLWEGLEAESVV